MDLDAGSFRYVHINLSLFVVSFVLFYSDNPIKRTRAFALVLQLVEKPAVAIKPEQVFCMKSKRTEKKEEDFLSILLV